MSETMKIVSLKAENFKKLTAVEITPEGNLVQITGKNGQGKSSVLDAIWAALGGTKNHPMQPIREGAETARVDLDMGDYVITRTFNPKGTTLVVKNKQGARYDSPQSLLDKLLGDLTFDPLEFSRMKAAEQFERLRLVSGLGDELTQLDAEEKTSFEARTLVNRDLATAKGQLGGFTEDFSAVPDEPVDTAEVMAEAEKLQAENRAIEAAGQEIASRKATFDANEEEIERLCARIKELGEKNVTEESAMRELEPAANKKPHDLEPLREKVRSANGTNLLVNRKKEKARVEQLVADHQNAADELTKAVEGVRERRQKLVESAKMPVAGLSLQDGQVFLNGIPFSQASTAEQLKVSVAIAMAANPSIRVIRIKDGALLDSDSMSALREMADGADYQIWVERVDGSGEVGIVMEDGHVKAVNVDEA